MRQFIFLAMFVSGCTGDIPPETVGPVAEVCRKYGLEVQVSRYQIQCFKQGEK